MNFLKLSSAAFVAGWVLTSAVAAPDVEKRDSCTAKQNELTATFVAQDWRVLIKVAETYLKTCHGVHDRNDEAFAMEWIAIANLRLGDINASIRAAERCIEFHYQKHGCHIRRAEALLAKGEDFEAEQSLSRAERLIPHLLDSNARELRLTTDVISREVLTSRREELISAQELAASIRNRYFAK